MGKLEFDEIVKRSKNIRDRYHELEKSNHGSQWTIEEDALAFLTDAGLVGRNVMSQLSRWPKENSEQELGHKIGECIWWLIVLAERNELKPKQLVADFLTKTEAMLK